MSIWFDFYLVIQTYSIPPYFFLSYSKLEQYLFFLTLLILFVRLTLLLSSMEELDISDHPGDRAHQDGYNQTPIAGRQISGIRNCSMTFILAVSAAVLGAFQFGFAIGNVANTIPIIKTTFNTSDMFISLFVSGNPIGGLFGALLAGFVADKVGRRKSMILNVFPFLVGCCLMGWSGNQWILLAGRVVVGFGVGIGSGLTNIFLAEVAPISIRGGIGMLYGVMITVGTLLSYLLSMPGVIGDGSAGWRLFLAFPILPALYQSLVLLGCPESPRHLAFNKQDKYAALSALAKYRRTVSKEEEESLLTEKLSLIHI